MFVGHYGIALAAKRLSPRTSLGWTFLAVQFLDLLWVPAILLGIEHARIIPGYLPASSIRFTDFPWTHSLVMALAWGWLVFRFSKNAVLGGCVFSHWVLDWFVHDRDLPLYRGGPEVGLGLWNYRAGTVAAESLILLVGLWIYLRATRPLNAVGRFGMIGFVALLIGLEVMNVYGSAEPGNVRAMAIVGEVMYLGFAGAAYGLDRMREPLPEEPPVRLNLAE
jgi:hypothetical protein